MKSLKHQITIDSFDNKAFLTGTGVPILCSFGYHSQQATRFDEPMIFWWANRCILTFNIDETHQPDSRSLTINYSCLLCFPSCWFWKQAFFNAFTLSNNEWEAVLLYIIYICIYIYIHTYFFSAWWRYQNSLLRNFTNPLFPWKDDAEKTSTTASERGEIMLMLLHHFFNRLISTM